MGKQFRILRTLHKLTVFFGFSMVSLSARAELRMEESFGLAVENASFSGGENQNENQFYKLASTSKVLTAYAALKTLGRDFTFDTTLSWRWAEGGPGSGKITQVNWQGSGDPTWGSPDYKETVTSRMQEIVANLVAQGVRSIEDPITYSADDAALRLAETPHGWLPKDLTQHFGARPEAFNMALNTDWYVIRGLHQGGWADPNVKIPVQLKLHRANVAEPMVYARRTTTGFEISGKIPRLRKTKSILLPTLFNVGRFHRTFLLACAQNGILVKQKTMSWTAKSKNANQEIVSRSRPLFQIIDPMLKNSINLVAEALVRKIGETVPARFAAEPLSARGARLIKDLADKLSDNHFSVFDGSGLSRFAQATPQGFANFLKNLKTTEQFLDVKNALSVTGQSGTLGRGKIGKKFAGTQLEGHFYGKTGTLSGTKNIVGYLETEPEHFEAVAFFGYFSRKMPVLSLLDIFKSELYKLLRAAVPQILDANLMDKNPGVETDCPDTNGDFGEQQITPPVEQPLTSIDDND